MSKSLYRRTVPVMGTLVTIDVVMGDARMADEPTPHTADSSAPQASAQLEAAVDRALAWFYQVEECCTRFDPNSELARLSAHIGVAVPASAILFQAVQFALAVAEESGGAFDPTVGAVLETRGFNREYCSGQVVRIAPGRANAATQVSSPHRSSYRDVHLDPERNTITLLRPLLLDLGAVAKGLAIDMAAHELRPFGNFAINAGGDVYVGGHNAQNAPWSIGIRHPRVPGALFETLRISDCAVCTSGDYERRCPVAADGDETAADAKTEVADHHILDPRISSSARSPHSPSSAASSRSAASASSARAAISATAIAPSAMLADALATAAFVLGPDEGIALLDRLGVDGIIISPTLGRHATRGMCSDNELSGATIFADAQGPSSDRPGGPDRASRAI